MQGSGDWKQLKSKIAWVTFLLVAPVHVLLVPTSLAYDTPLVEEGNPIFQNVDANTDKVIVQDNTIINWADHDIANGKRLIYEFLNPSLSLLSRDMSGNATQIDGILDILGGGLFTLVNTAGIHIGEHGVINADRLILSTLGFESADFMAGRFSFIEDAVRGPATLIHDGHINIINDGFAVLMGGAVQVNAPNDFSDGTSYSINAPLGEVALLAGKSITLGISGNNLISIAVDEAVTQDMGLDDQIRHRGSIKTLGGMIHIEAAALDGLFRNSINIEGIPVAAKVDTTASGIVVLQGTGDITTDMFVDLTGDQVFINADSDQNGTGKFTNNGMISSWYSNYFISASEDSNLGSISILNDLRLRNSAVGFTPNYYTNFPQLAVNGDFIVQDADFTNPGVLKVGAYFEFDGGTYHHNGGVLELWGSDNAYLNAPGQDLNLVKITKQMPISFPFSFAPAITIERGTTIPLGDSPSMPNIPMMIRNHGTIEVGSGTWNVYGELHNFGTIEADLNILNIYSSFFNWESSNFTMSGKYLNVGGNFYVHDMANFQNNMDIIFKNFGAEDPVGQDGGLIYAPNVNFDRFRMMSDAVFDEFGNELIDSGNWHVASDIHTNQLGLYAVSRLFSATSEMVNLGEMPSWEAVNTFYVTGDFLQYSNAVMKHFNVAIPGGSNLEIRLVGSGNQGVYQDTFAAHNNSALVIDKTGGAVFLANDYVGSAYADITVENGNLDLNGYDVNTGGDIVIKDGLFMEGGENVSYGSISFETGSTLHLTGNSDGNADTFIFDLGGVFHNIEIANTPDNFRLDSDRSLMVRGDFTIRGGSYQTLPLPGFSKADHIEGDLYVLGGLYDASSAYELDVNGSVYIGGGTLDVSGAYLELDKDFTFINGDFINVNSVLHLRGVGDQQIISGGVVFDNILSTKTGGVVTFFDQARVLRDFRATGNETLDFNGNDIVTGYGYFTNTGSLVNFANIYAMNGFSAYEPIYLTQDTVINADADQDNVGAIGALEVFGNGHDLTLLASEDSMIVTLVDANLTLAESAVGSNPIFNTVPVLAFVPNDLTIASGRLHRFVGSGTQVDPFGIWDVYGLQAMQNWDNAYFELLGDLDASTAAGWNGGLGFDSIGDMTNPFNSWFDGAGHTISNLTMRGDREMGLFGATDQALIQNLHLENVNIQNNTTIFGITQMGALVGRAEDTDIIGVTASGTIIGGPNSTNIGGLVGQALTSTITQSSSSVNVTGTINVGGLVGGSNNAILYQVFSTGDVAGYDNVGGLVGGNDGTIIDSYSTSDVFAASNRSAGGLVGYNTGGILYAFASGRVIGTAEAGGLVGQRFNPNPGVVQYSYWDMDATGQTTSDGGEGLTSLEMEDQTNFTGFNFSVIWNMPDGGGAPVLQWQGIAAAPVPPAPIIPDPVVPDPIVLPDPEPPTPPAIEDDNTLIDPTPIVVPETEPIVAPIENQLTQPTPTPSTTEDKIETSKAPEKNSEYVKPEGTVVPDNNSNTPEGLGIRSWNLEGTKAMENPSLRAPPPTEAVSKPARSFESLLDTLIAKDQAQDSSKTHKGLESPHKLKNRPLDSKDATSTISSSTHTKDFKIQKSPGIILPDSIDPTKVSPYLNRNLSQFSNIYNHGPPSKESSSFEPYSSSPVSSVPLEVPSEYLTDPVFPALPKDHSNRLKTNTSLVSQEGSFYLPTVVSNPGGKPCFRF